MFGRVPFHRRTSGFDFGKIKRRSSFHSSTAMRRRPCLLLAVPSPMTTIDRIARDCVAAEVRRFLHGDATAFEFDDALFKIESKDRTVNNIVRCLWLYYDDCKDHHVTLSKEEWDYFQRLLLILESDRHISTQRIGTQWRLTQFLALVALVGFAVCVKHLGLGQPLLAICIPFGMVSMGIAAWRRLSMPQRDRTAMALDPFSSLAELRATYTSVGTFRKTPYRKELSGATSRSLLTRAIIWILVGALWLTFAPVVLFFQILPHHHSETRVVDSA